MNKKIQAILMMLIAVALSGCANLRSMTMPDNANLLSGAGSIIVHKHAQNHTNDADTAQYEQIDVNALIDDYGLQPRVISTNPQSATFNYLRNELQDRIIAASNQRCATFMRTLTSSKAQSSMIWGNVSTLLASAATVTTPIGIAKALAAGSAVSNGVLSRYDDAYFNHLSISVINGGIARNRQAVLERILAERKNDLSVYSVNRAVADAISYHAACNVVSGLETAAASLKNVTNAELVGAAIAPQATGLTNKITVQQSLSNFEGAWSQLDQGLLNVVKNEWASKGKLAALRNDCVKAFSEKLVSETTNAEEADRAQASAKQISEAINAVMQRYIDISANTKSANNTASHVASSDDINLVSLLNNVKTSCTRDAKK